MIWGKRLYCINKSKDKNSNRSFSVTSSFKSHWLCRSSATQAALWLFLQVILLPWGSSCSLAQGFLLQLPAPVADCTARCSAHPLLTRHFFCSTEKLSLLLFWQASLPPTYAFSPSSPAKTHLSWATSPPFHFHTSHIKWFLCESSKYTWSLNIRQNLWYILRVLMFYL